MIKALIFDFDGLMVDTETPEFRSWEQVFAEHGLKLPMDSWVRYVGQMHAGFDPYRALEEGFGRPIVKEEIRARRRELYAEYFVDRGLLPGVADDLETAQRLEVKSGLASSAEKEWICGHLERLGIGEFFEAIATREDAERTKPDPELFLLALERLGVAAAEGIALEDSPNGALAAHRAGLFCVAVPNEITRRMEFVGAGMVLESLADMPLERLLVEVERRRQASCAE